MYALFDGATWIANADLETLQSEYIDNPDFHMEQPFIVQVVWSAGEPFPV